MKTFTLIFVFVAIFSWANASSCPCNPGVNENIKTLENFIVFINRAIMQTKPGSYSAFLKLFQNIYNQTLKVLAAPSFGLAGAINTSPLFREFLLEQNVCINKTLTSVNGGSDPLEGIEKLLKCLKKVLLKAIDAAKKATSGGYKQTSPVVDARNKALIQYWKDWVKLIDETCQCLQDPSTTPTECLVSYLKKFWTATLGNLHGARDSCPCLIPCCKY